VDIVEFRSLLLMWLNCRLIQETITISQKFASVQFVIEVKRILVMVAGWAQLYVFLQVRSEGEAERLRLEISELQNGGRDLRNLLEQKNQEIEEKNVAIKSYLDKIVRPSSDILPLGIPGSAMQSASCFVLSAQKISVMHAQSFSEFAMLK
jgi:hypothetical protein